MLAALVNCFGPSSKTEPVLSQEARPGLPHAGWGEQGRGLSLHQPCPLLLPFFARFYSRSPVPVTCQGDVFGPLGRYRLAAGSERASLLVVVTQPVSHRAESGCFEKKPMIFQLKSQVTRGRPLQLIYMERSQPHQAPAGVSCLCDVPLSHPTEEDVGTTQLARGHTTRSRPRRSDLSPPGARVTASPVLCREVSVRAPAPQ